MNKLTQGAETMRDLKQQLKVKEESKSREALILLSFCDLKSGRNGDLKEANHPEQATVVQGE